MNAGGSFENDMDFGNGETCHLNGHLDWLPYKGAQLIDRPDGAGIRMLCNNEGLRRIRDSSVLQHLAPSSGLLPGLADAFSSQLTGR